MSSAKIDFESKLIHADIVTGMIVAKSEMDYKKLRSVMTNMGCNMDPHQAFMTRRGLKTLAVGIEKVNDIIDDLSQALDKIP